MVIERRHNLRGLHCWSRLNSPDPSIGQQHLVTDSCYFMARGRSRSEHPLKLVPSECKQLGFDTVELNTSFLKLPEDTLLRYIRAERCLEAGADMISIDVEGICRFVDSVRSDIIAKVIGRLGLEKTMFEASNSKTSKWFIKQYGPNVNLFIDHSQVLDLECLRGSNMGKNHRSVLNSSFFLL
nr:hypothetical protein [Tanacetum cinerariifolium]